MRKSFLLFVILAAAGAINAAAGVLRIENEEIRYGEMSSDIIAFKQADKLWTQSAYSPMAIILFDLSAKGYRKPIALLGNAYAGGFGVPRSIVSARMQWRRAAMLGNDFAMRTLANNYEVSREESSPQDSAFWSVVSNAFEDPSSSFSIGVKLTSERLGKLPEHERTLVLMTAKEMIDRIKSNKARYESVINSDL